MAKIGNLGVGGEGYMIENMELELMEVKQKNGSVDGNFEISENEFDFNMGQVISKFLSILLDYPTEEKIEKAKALAKFLCSYKEILPDYIIELATEVLNVNFSQDLQADYVEIFDFQTPPFISFCVKGENQNLILILDSIYLSEGVFVDETKLPDEFATVFEFLSLLYLRKRKEKINYMKELLKPILHFPEPNHPLYEKVIKSVKRFIQSKFHD